TTDITEHALETLKQSKIKNVILVGRRGPLQISFTAKELREMFQLPNTRFHTDVDLLKEEFSNHAGYISTIRSLKRLTQILEKGIYNVEGDKSWTLKFLRSPTAFVADNDSQTQFVKAAEFSVNRLEGDVRSAVAVPTGEVETIETGLVIKSVGYRSLPVEGIPFDKDRGLVYNERGKITDSNGEEVRLNWNSSLFWKFVEINPIAFNRFVDKLPGMYVAGWLKRGATGVIAATMYDAFETAEVIISDLQSNKPMLNGVASSKKPGATAILPLLAQRGIRTVSYKDWKKIEARESELGQQKGKPREKLAKIEEVLKILDE
ncbi:3178_t:CDS:2, partial [Paraglomus occultum]